MKPREKGNTDQHEAV